jgi:hypothetical protein
MPVFPWLAVVGGVGFAAVRAGLVRRLWRARETVHRIKRPVWVGAGLLLAVAALNGHAVWQSHPFQLSYFNALVGGVRGADAAGFDVSYWGEAGTRDFYRALSAAVPGDARIGWSFDEPAYFRTLASYGLPERRLNYVHQPPFDFYLVLNRKGMFNAWDAYYHETQRPVAAATYDGIRLIAVYKCDPAPEIPWAPWYADPAWQAVRRRRVWLFEDGGQL